MEPGLARSWLRSFTAGLQPQGRTLGAPHASAAQLARELERDRALVAHARPVMEFLHEQTRDSESMSILAGADGMLLQSLGDPHFVGRAERVALRPGATWHENFRGTNAIGTALVDDRAVVIHADEHYLERNGFLTCAAVPIHDPAGRVLGVLDVSGDHRGFHRHTLGLVRSAVRMIEHRLFDTHHGPDQWSGLRLCFHTQAEGLGTVAEGLLAVSLDGTLVGANQAALALLELSWERLREVKIGAVLAEPLDNLVAWGRRGPSTPRQVRTVSGRPMFMRVDAGRVVPVSFVTVPTPPPAPVLAPVQAAGPRDALAALDTGDAVFRAAIDRARKVAGKPIALLLQGESGVGKEIFARAVHLSGPRREKPLVAVNCAALPETLIEAELFGYAAGAFTGAQKKGAPGRIREADGGTLFLDEIGDMPLPLQARLLRVLQERVVVPLGGGKPVAVDFALICATHRDLPAEMAAGRFREDLYYRLNGLTLRLPALRDRTDLTDLLERELTALVPDRSVSVDAEVLAALTAYRWPGNVRQLFNALRTACALLDADETTIDWAHLPDDLLQAVKPLAPAPVSPPVAATAPSVAEAPTNLRTVELEAMERAIAACDGNLSEAARMLGISRNTLYRRRRV